LKFRTEQSFAVSVTKGYATPWAIAQWYVDKQMKGLFSKKSFETSHKHALILILNY